MSDQSDEAIVQRVVAGDTGAFRILVERHERKLRAFLGRVSDTSDTDDIAQEAFLIAFKKIDEFTGEGSFAAWLFRIAYRKLLNDGRSSRRRREREARVLGEAEVPAPSSAALDLERVLKVLDDQERAAILLCLGAGLSHSEASRVLLIPLGTVKSLIARAREKAVHFLAGETP